MQHETIETFEKVIN